MLVGRERERAAIHALLSAARVGQSGTLVLIGEAGIGKTALLNDAGATAHGMRVLRATGSEVESEVPFGALLQLLRPALVHLDRIPVPQSDALASALALRPGTGDDRFAVGAATLSLLSRFAEDQPVAILVDDAHLLDVPSAQALTFAARRLTADPIAIVAAVRAGQSGSFLEAALPVLHVAGLSLAATKELLAVGGRRVADAEVTRLYDFTGGNPLAVVVLADEAAGLDMGPFGTPTPVPASLARAFARRLDSLSEGARIAVLVAAASAGELDVVGGACRLLGGTVSALAEAEDAGLLQVRSGGLGGWSPDGSPGAPRAKVVFRHNLVRSAVYSDAPPSLRRAVHRALSEALPVEDIDRRAWHLGEAAFGPDEDIAGALTTVGAAASSRSAHAVASGAYERAARLSPAAPDRADRYIAAGESAWRAGLADRAVALLGQASALGLAPEVQARINGLRGRIAARTGSVEAARDLLMAAGTDIAEADPDAAVLLLAEGILACFFLGDTASLLPAAAEIDRFAGRAVTDRASVVGAMASGVAGVLAGRGGPEQIRRAVQHIVSADLLVEDLGAAPWLVLGPLFLRESDTGRHLVSIVVDSLRRRSIVGGLPFLLFHVGRDQATTDRWDVAELTYAEGIALAREAGQTTDLAACLAGLAWLEARQGREVACRNHAAEASGISSSRHIALFQCWSLFALGELELGLGRPDTAMDHFLHLDALLTDLALVDVDLSPAPELADALVRVGRDDEARDAASRYAVRASAKGQPWALGRAARAVALTCPETEIDQRFGAALDHHLRTPDVFELARTQLSYGSRLRRARRRVHARPILRSSLRTFESLGAVPWADQAARELGATGETVQRRGANALTSLTPQELQVARMLAGGRTTKEAAAALFLSPKTVEYHLRHVYGKLAIGSRAELASRLDSRS